MRITPHAIAAVTLVLVAAALAVPALLALPGNRPVPIDRLTVPAEQVRPPLATANRALNALVPKHAGMPMITPFALRERGGTGPTAIPMPPPPLLQLPEPPLTPFGPATSPLPR